MDCRWPVRPSGIRGSGQQRSYAIAHKNYRQACILLAKSMITPAMVSMMCHAEVSVWIETVLESMGIKNDDDNVIISLRQRKPKPFQPVKDSLLANQPD
ncbi:hypothetical protein BGI33_05480 [Snodgrassella alvi]|nr:hypothetical protein BGI33_05480 [Snodgrassella alvi]PIT18044.1 hypothetical protein BGI34_06120 [Snodgrassella alvi]PIT49240.1 hypothetical protein BHC51_03930 [Snodgrassella alvi]